MKIGLVLDDSLDSSDGVQQYVVTIGKWLSAKGHDVHYLVGQTTRTDLPNIHSLSRTMKVSANGNKMSMPLPAKSVPIRELLQKEQFDVLHVQMPYSPFMAAKVIRNAGPTTAIIGTFHILPFSKLEYFGTRLLGIWLRGTLRRFDQIVSVSQPAADFAARTFRIQSQVLPNAVDLSRFQAGKSSTTNNDKKVSIVYLGRLVERKGCQQLLRAISKLPSVVNVRVVVGGTGPLEAKLRHFVQENQLSNAVQFAGFIPEEQKADYLASADIVALPSLSGESFGIVLIEAMAASPGVVIAGDNPGYRSVMSELPDQLVQPNDTEKFAETLQHFIQDGQARATAHAKQIKTIQAYDVNQVGARLLQIYVTAQSLRTSKPVR